MAKLKRVWIGERRVLLPVLKGKVVVGLVGLLHQRQYLNLRVLFKQAKTSKFLSSKFLIAPRGAEDAKVISCLMPLNLLKPPF